MNASWISGEVEPLAGWPYPDHFSHIAFRAGVLGGVLDFDQDDEEQVVPHVVLHLDVLLEGDRLIVELVPLQTYSVQSRTHAIACRARERGGEIEREREREKNLSHVVFLEELRNSPNDFINFMN